MQYSQRRRLVLWEAEAWIIKIEVVTEKMLQREELEVHSRTASLPPHKAGEAVRLWSHPLRISLYRTK